MKKKYLGTDRRAENHTNIYIFTYVYTHIHIYTYTHKKKYLGTDRRAENHRRTNAYDVPYMGHHYEGTKNTLGRIGGQKIIGGPKRVRPSSSRT